jgi:glycosyltransferase involved in cell wall biosynthesis
VKTIEAVTVCVNYADYLVEAAPFNVPHLSRWIIVTTPQDEETRQVCRRFGLECITTEEHRRDNGAFGKGRLIHRGVSALRGGDFILQLDADIVLPTDLQTLLDEAHLDSAHVFGCDRLNVTGFDAWQRVKAGGLLCRSNPWAVELHRPDCRLGTRVANRGHGYTPIGYFQLWHGSASNWRDFVSKPYPFQHGTAARTDVMHSLQWDRRQRTLIPELLVWHLESEPAEMGANWAGRRTKRFGPRPVGQVADLSGQVSDLPHKADLGKAECYCG